MVASASDPKLVLVDAAGTICVWSRGAEQAFGFAAEHALGRTLDLIVPLEHRAAHWAGFRRAFEAGAAAAEGQASPFPVQYATGEIADHMGRLTLIRSPGGQVVAAVVVFD